MKASGPAVFMILMFASLLMFPLAEGKVVEDERDVDIDSYVWIRIDFDEGDGLELKADISAAPDPVSVFLIKGTEEFERWRATEDLDIDSVKGGNSSSSGNDTFVVVENFSESNITSFSRSMSIGERDTYYLVIVIYRDPAMDAQEVLGRASRVSYRVEWNIERKEVPYYLIPVAVTLFVIGLVLILHYFRSVKRAGSGDEEGPRPGKPNGPGQGSGRFRPPGR